MIGEIFCIQIRVRQYMNNKNLGDKPFSLSDELLLEEADDGLSDGGRYIFISGRG